MSSPFVGEIRMFAGNFAPAGWATFQGQLMPISENETLFQLIGTTYGGDGITTFAVPDLRGRVPVHQGNTTVIGEVGGAEMVTLGRIVALSMVDGSRAGLAELDTAAGDPVLADHHRFHAVRAHLLDLIGDPAGARAEYELAARRTLSIPERAYLESRRIRRI